MSVIRLVVLVLSGRPVIHHTIALYVTLSVADTAGISVHHTEDTQNIAGRIAVIAR